MSFRCINCRTEIDPQFKACPYCGEPVTDFLRRYANEPVDGKYELLSRLGRGGMGEVFKVTHTHLGATRVIKLMRPAIIGETEAQERFLREARLATRIHHPNVATLHDFSKLPDGTYYMVWEYIEGETLTKVIQRLGRLSPRYAAQVSIEALMGLDAIHRAGIVHRDVSPDNIMISRDESGEERVKIIDLGIAKQEGDIGGQQTRTGMFVGKWKYCSPEHLGFLPEGEKIDGRADIYSFGIVMYEMLTGTPPFVSETPSSYIAKHAKETPRPLRNVNPSVPEAPELEAVIFRALEKDRNNRFQTAREFALELSRILPALPGDEGGDIDLSAQPTIALSPTQRATTVPAASPAQRATTVRSVSGAQPLPAPPPRRPLSAAPTVLESQGTAKPGNRLALLIGLGILAIAVIGGLAFYAFRNRPAPAVAEKAPSPVQSPAVRPPTAPPAAAPSPAQPAAPAGETVAVVETKTAPAVPAVTTTQTAVPPAPRKKQQQTATPATPVTSTEEEIAVPMEEAPASEATATAAPAKRRFNPFHRGGAKRFVDSDEYKAGVSGGIIRDYSLLAPGDSVQWAWADPGTTLAQHRISITRFRNPTKVQSAKLMSMLKGDLQSALDDATEDGGDRLSAEGLVYWAEDSKTTKRGVGIEMVIRDAKGRTVAALRHRVYENSPEDAAEEVIDAVADFVEDH